MRSRWVVLFLGLLGACQLPTDLSAPSVGAGSGGAADSGIPTGDVGPHPIVLCHGMFGARNYLGILDYWSTIPDVLEAAGHEVYITEVDPLNTPMARGDRLIEELEALRVTSGHSKFVLIGHSQGGLDVRYVASVRPDLVAAVVTMASPHGGTPAVDIAIKILEDGGPIEAAVNALENLFGPMIYSEATDATNVYTSLHSMTKAGAASFGAAYPPSASVPYFSITGVTDRVTMQHAHCTPDRVVPFVQRWASERDPASIPLNIAEALLDDDNLLDVTSNTYPNDGLVRAIDTHYGTFLGCIPGDHAEELGIVNGLLSGYHPGCYGVCTGTTDTALCDCNDFDYEAFWVDMASWLRAEGY